MKLGNTELEDQGYRFFQNICQSVPQQRILKKNNCPFGTVRSQRTCIVRTNAAVCSPGERHRSVTLVTLDATANWRRGNDDVGIVSRPLSPPKRYSCWHIVSVRTRFTLYTRQSSARRAACRSQHTRDHVVIHTSRFPVRFPDNFRRATMKPTSFVFVALSLYATVSTAAAGSCKYSVESYTTTDAMIVTEAAFISQVVSADCEDPPSNLYAEVDGKLVVAANAGPNKYQVSWPVIMPSANPTVSTLLTVAMRLLHRSVGWTISRRPAAETTWSTSTTKPATDSWGSCCATASPSAPSNPYTRRTCITPGPTEAPGWIPSSWPPSWASWFCTLRIRSNRKSSPNDKSKPISYTKPASSFFLYHW